MKFRATTKYNIFTKLIPSKTLKRGLSVKNIRFLKNIECITLVKSFVERQSKENVSCAPFYVRM